MPVPDTAARRRERRAVSEWALAVGRPASAELIAQLQTMKVAHSHRRSLPYYAWPESTLVDLLWVDAASWGRTVEPTTRTRMAESLWTYLQFLEAHGLLHVSSGCLEDLLEIIGDTGGLTSDGRCRPGRAKHAAVVDLRRVERRRAVDGAGHRRRTVAAAIRHT